MTARIFAYVAHKGGVADDSAAELLAAAKKIDPAASPTAVVTGAGAELDAVCDSLRASYGEVWKIADESLAYPNAELVRKALVKVIPAGSIVLVAHNHFGIDLAPGLSIKLNAALCRTWWASMASKASCLKVVRQEFGGQVSTHVRCDISSGAVINLRPGAFKPIESAAANGCCRQVVRRSAHSPRVAVTWKPSSPKPAMWTSPRSLCWFRSAAAFRSRTTSPSRRSWPTHMGAAVSCSRPVVDAKWLPKSRQVGSSGQTVKPKIYLACGISGSFQHLAGLKGNPFIVAINKNPKAPIFQVADVGIVADILEFLPELN